MCESLVSDSNCSNVSQTSKNKHVTNIKNVSLPNDTMLTNHSSETKNSDKSVIDQCNPGIKQIKDISFNFMEPGLRIANLNIQHLLPKLEEINYHLQNKNSPDVLGLCETFLSNHINNDLLHLQNYVIERKDRSHKKGGGLLVYIRSSVIYKRRSDLEVTDIESVWLEIGGKQCKSFLVNFVPPNANHL